FDGDGFADLAIMVFENDNGGAVHVLFGDQTGLTSDENDFLFQGDPLGTFGSQEQNDHFGSSLAVGHFDDDPYADLAVGAWGEDVQLLDIGWVHVFYGGTSGFEDRRQELFDQGVLGQAVEAEDAFGSSLAAGDFDGDGFDDLTIGSLGESVSVPGANVGRAGSVTALYGTPTGLVSAASQVWTQDSDNVSDQPEFADGFGSSLASGDFDGDGRDDLGIGVPFEDFEGGGHVNNGAVHAFYSSAQGLSPAVREQYHGQGVWGVGATESGDTFGNEMTTGDFNSDGVASLVVGVPFEDIAGMTDVGIVAVITGELGANVLIFADGFERGDTLAW
ncbi:MAG: hypothetical protein K8J08_04080, partial [Thermoanaerobaculia bacterium]|nr:hypothetical protein [Thermoanaerobaculia bacterium]